MVQLDGQLGGIRKPPIQRLLTIFGYHREVDMRGLIYKATCKTTGKHYIGRTIMPFKKRQYDHLYHAKKGCQFKLHRAIRLYGEDDFEWSIVEEIEGDNDAINVREVYCITFYDSFQNGYNLTMGGEGKSGWKASDEARERMRQSRLGKKNSEESKQKARSALLGRKRPKEVCEKISKGQMGKKLSPEQIEIMRKNSTGRRLSESAKEKVRAFQTGIKRSEETKRKLSEIRKAQVRKLRGDDKQYELLVTESNDQTNVGKTR